VLLVLAAAAEASNLRTLGTYLPPDDMQVIFDVVGSPGASISTSNIYNANCYTNNGDGSTEAIMQPDIIAAPVKNYGLTCRFNFHFPNAKSGSCSAKTQVICSQEFGPEGDWICSLAHFDFYDNNVCAHIRGGWPGDWNVNEGQLVNHITVQPNDPTNPQETVIYDGKTEASWKVAGAGGKLELMESTTFTNTETRTAAQSSTLKIDVGKVSFGGAEMGGSYSQTASNSITSTVSQTHTQSRKCTTVECQGNIYQGLFKVFTKDEKNYIFVETCIFQCEKSQPKFAPGAEIKSLHQ